MSFKVGQQVAFGRIYGEKTLGVIVKVNRKSVRVKALENRGQYAGVGQIWRVHPSLITVLNEPVIEERALSRRDARDASSNRRGETDADILKKLLQFLSDREKTVLRAHFMTTLTINDT